MLVWQLKLKDDFENQTYVVPIVSFRKLFKDLKFEKMYFTKYDKPCLENFQHTLQFPNCSILHLGVIPWRGL